jgi:hypothetical protein
MKVKELIEQLNKVVEQYGDIDCAISIDVSNAFNATSPDQEDVNRYEAQIDYVLEQHFDFPDGTYKYEVCLHGELYLVEEE